MLSVLIPTYNYRCYTLVADLREQLEREQCPYEIIVADDGSRDRVSIIANLKINELSNCRYIRLEKNLGRSGIRNFLIDEARGEWLLFMDSDARVVNTNFISRYLAASEGKEDVIVGGLTNPESLPSPEVTLRYFYEKAAESERGAQYRQQHPYDRFSTFNFMARKEVLSQIRFSTECKDYGWEDYLLGKELEKEGKTILHIDNPLMHMGIENNNIYLHKTEVALRTLHSLPAQQAETTRIGHAAATVRKMHLTGLVRHTYSLLHPFMHRNLLGTKPNMTIFAFYKLGYYCSLK